MGNYRQLFIAALLMSSVIPAAMADSGPYIGLRGGAGLQWEAKGGPTGGVVGGYTFENGLRPELEFDYHRNSFKGGGGNDQAETGTANLYYNAAVNGYYFYIGGGAGYAHVHVHVDQLGSDNDDKPIYSGGAGFGLAVTNNILLGVDYRYIGTFARINAASTADGSALDGSFHYRSNVVTVALRYSFGKLSDTVYVPDQPVRVIPLQLPPPPPMEGYSN